MISRLLGELHRFAGSNDFTHLIACKIKNQLDAMVRAGLSDGIHMECNGELWLMRTIAPHTANFVDVGANIGEWTRQFLELCDDMAVNGLLFEPSPSAFEELSKNLSRVNHQGTIKISPQAVSDMAGQMEFFEEQSFGETSSLVKAHSNPHAKSRLVDVVTLDESLLESQVKNVDFLKIDAEGYDLHVIKGARKFLTENRIGVIQFEYNAPWAHAGSTLFDAISFLENFGYQIFLLRRDGLKKFDYLKYGEYFGYSNFVAISPASFNLLKNVLFEKS